MKQEKTIPTRLFRSGLPVQANIRTDHTALKKWKVQLQHEHGAGLHGGLWAVNEQHARAMIAPLRGWKISKLEQIGTFRAIFWDNAFLDHVAPLEEQKRAKFEIAVYPGADPGTYHATLTRTKPNNQLLAVIQADSAAAALQCLAAHMTETNETGGL